MRMIEMLRHDARSGQTNRFEHVGSAFMMAQALTNAKCENSKCLKQAVDTGWLQGWAI